MSNVNHNVDHYDEIDLANIFQVESKASISNLPFAPAALFPAGFSMSIFRSPNTIPGQF